MKILEWRRASWIDQAIMPSSHHDWLRSLFGSWLTVLNSNFFVESFDKISAGKLCCMSLSFLCFWKAKHQWYIRWKKKYSKYPNMPILDLYFGPKSPWHRKKSSFNSNAAGLPKCLAHPPIWVFFWHFLPLRQPICVTTYMNFDSPQNPLLHLSFPLSKINPPAYHECIQEHRAVSHPLGIGRNSP